MESAAFCAILIHTSTEYFNSQSLAALWENLIVTVVVLQHNRLRYDTFRLSFVLSDSQASLCRLAKMLESPA